MSNDNTKIEWTDATWSPIVGCTHISPGCEHCYAASLTSGRLAHTPTYEGLAEGGRFNGTIRLLPDRLSQPLRWSRPRMIFVNSMSDWCHEGVPDEYIAKMFAVMAQAPRHTFQLLTKRHGRMRSLLNSRQFRTLVRAELAGGLSPEQIEGGATLKPQQIARIQLAAEPAWPLRNVWVGVSAEDQKWAGIRIPALLDTLAAVRFVSAEPLLSPIDLSRWLPSQQGETLDWIIVGGESGAQARPMNPDWVRSIRDQCQAAGVAFHFKQFGEWAPVGLAVGQVPPGVEGEYVYGSRREHWFPRPPSQSRFTHTVVRRIGKKAAGRTLDGSVYDGYPATLAKAV
jgi:protein gp37